MHFLLGDPAAVEEAPEVPFHPLRVDLLADLSKVLMADPRAKAYPDLVTFAFACRRAHLEGYARAWEPGKVRLGLGLVFHVTPSNVPINAAYSLLFAFLAGNASLVRLPSRDSVQMALLIEALGGLLAEPRYAPLRPAIHLVRYERADEVTSFWTERALGRVVWGGDATVAHLRSMNLHPRSREVAFPDRYSLCALDAARVLEADEADLQTLARGMYLDLYLMDQMACSSPQLVAWVGPEAEVARAQARLWPRVVDQAKGAYALEPIHAMDRFVDLCLDLLDHGNIARVDMAGPWLTRIGLSGFAVRQTRQRGRFGTVHEVGVPSLDALAPLVDPSFQTLTQFGFEREHLRAFVLSNRLAGIDRIVPVGRSLDMGFAWDGFEVLAALSRLVDIQ